MITRSKLKELQQRSYELIQKAGFPITESEKERIDAADFGLSRPEIEGVQILNMVQSDRIAAKVLVLLPNQTEPEHWHPPVGDDPGKEETVRALYGDLFFYVEGEDTLKEGFIVEGKEGVYTLRHEIPLRPGEQLHFKPGEKHWFQAGESGAVLFSFSSVVRDALDGFTDPEIDRITKIVED